MGRNSISAKIAIVYKRLRHREKVMEQSKSNIILYQTADGTANIEVTLANDTVWLTADQMTELFQRDRSTIQRHIKSVYQDNELPRDSTCASFAQVQKRAAVRSHAISITSP